MIPLSYFLSAGADAVVVKDLDRGLRRVRGKWPLKG